MKRFSLLACVFTLSACSSGEEHVVSTISSSGQTTQSEEHHETLTFGPTEPAGPACPFGLAESETYRRYRAIGVEITLDCKALEGRAYDHKYTAEEFTMLAKALDSSLNEVRSAPFKLAQIAIGKRAFQQTRNALIQVPIGHSAEELKGLPQFMRNTLRLMQRERDTFAGEVRFTYSPVELLRDANGNIVDGGMLFMPAPTDGYVFSDLEMIDRFATQIAAHRERYPNVVLSHGSELSFFEVDNRSRSYTLSSGLSDSDIRSFFNYLSDLEKMEKNLGGVDVKVELFRDFMSSPTKIDFSKTAQMMNVGNALKDLLQARPSVKMLWLSPNNLGSMRDERLTLAFDGGRLRVENMFDMFGRLNDTSALRACITGQDFSKPFRAKCNNR